MKFKGSLSLKTSWPFLKQEKKITHTLIYKQNIPSKLLPKYYEFLNVLKPINEKYLPRV